MGRVMGVDYGKKRVGIAISDEHMQFAFPRIVLDNNSKLLAEVSKLIADEHIQVVVVGESVDYKGRNNQIMVDARDFAEQLVIGGAVELVFENEILTSAQAKRQFESNERTRKPKKTNVVDASAAALILQGYLDKQRG